jgi:hypothetical protein
VYVQAFDNQEVTRVELYLDGQLKSTSDSSTLKWNWNTRKESAGTHTLTSKAFDAAGNVNTDSITVYK